MTLRVYLDAHVWRSERKEEREEERRREKKREEEKTNTRDIRDTTRQKRQNDRRDRREQKRTEETPQTFETPPDKEEPRATTTIKQQSKLPNVRFTLRDHVPRQPFLPTDADSAVQHQFRVGRVVGGVVLQQFYSFSVQVCL